MGAACPPTPRIPRAWHPPGSGPVGRLGSGPKKGREHAAVVMEMEMGDSGFSDLSH